MRACVQTAGHLAWRRRRERRGTLRTGRRSLHAACAVQAAAGTAGTTLRAGLAHLRIDLALAARHTLCAAAEAAAGTGRVRRGVRAVSRQPAFVRTCKKSCLHASQKVSCTAVDCAGGLAQRLRWLASVCAHVRMDAIGLRLAKGTGVLRAGLHATLLSSQSRFLVQQERHTHRERRLCRHPCLVPCRVSSSARDREAQARAVSQSAHRGAAWRVGAGLGGGRGPRRCRGRGGLLGGGGLFGGGGLLGGGGGLDTALATALCVLGGGGGLDTALATALCVAGGGGGLVTAAAPASIRINTDQRQTQWLSLKELLSECITWIDRCARRVEG